MPNPETVTVNINRDLATYLRLRGEGWTTLWSGEGRICLKAPAPAEVKANA